MVLARSKSLASDDVAPLFESAAWMERYSFSANVLSGRLLEVPNV